MQQPEDQFGDKLGWLIAFALVGGIFIYAVLQFPSLQEVACDAKETSCFRDWLSALGGWAAVAAAIPTVYYLQRQVRAASDHAKVNFAMSIRANVALATATEQAAIECLSQIERATEILENVKKSRTEHMAIVIVVFRLVSDILQRQHFSEFELRIGLPAKFSVGSMVLMLNSAVDTNKQLVRKNPSEVRAERYEEVRSNSLRLAMLTRSYMDMVIASSKGYIEDINHLGSRIS